MEKEEVKVTTPEEKREFLREAGMPEAEIEFMLAVESGELPDGDLLEICERQEARDDD
jgi:hypothetical protein